MSSVKKSPQLHFNLSEPNFTLLHRLGLAGLAMSLKQIEKQYPLPAQRPGKLNWCVDSRNIDLYWQGQDSLALDWLFKESFKINQRGLISFTGLNPESMPLPTQIVNHQCLTNSSFLQHNKFFKSGGVASESITVDEIPIEVKYKRAVSYAHQNFASKICDSEGNLYQEPIQIVSWLYPGAIVRHSAADKSTKIEETVEQAIALLYAPVACIYYLVQSKIHQKKAKYAVVIPVITNLESYALQRLELNHLNYKELSVTGTGDAGLKSLYYLANSKTTDSNKIQKCKVIVYGTFTWSTQQKVRGDVKLIKSTVAVNHHYQLIHHLFPNRVVKPPKKKALLL